MTNETVPELPEWVKVLIDDARSEGFTAGRRAGIEISLERIRKIERELDRW